MGFFFRIFQTSLNQRMRLVRNWVILLLIPCLILSVRIALPEQQVSAPVQVGVALPDEGAEDFWALLEQRSGTVLTFIQADADTIDRKIAAGQWDCGVILDDDFSERLAQLDTHRIFTVRIGAGSRVYPLVEETLAACMATLITGPMAEDYLEDTGILFDADFTWRGLDAKDRVIISMTTPDGTPMEAVELGSSGMQMLLCWLLSAAILVWLLLSSYDLGRWYRSEAAKPLLTLQHVFGVMLGRMAADWLLITLSGCCGMILLGNGLYGCIAVVIYSLFWASSGILLARISWLRQVLPLLPPFAVVMSLLFSGTLFDTAQLFPDFSQILVRFPTASFLRICRGDWRAAIIPVVFILLCLLLSAIPQKKK